MSPLVLAALLTAAAPGPQALDVRWDGDGFLTGRATLISIAVPPAAAPIVTLDGTLGERPILAFPASADRRRWLALVVVAIEQRVAPLPLTIDASLRDGARAIWSKPAPIAPAPYDERHLKVSKKYVKPSRAHRQRAAREARELAAVFDTITPERLWRGSLARPTAGVETSPFGTRRTYNDKRKSRHMGLDLDGKIGAAIVATLRGRVALAKERFYSGGTVVLDHGHGFFTLYFHMSRIDVRVGDVVEKGQGIGAVGATGQVTGPHLHFSARLADTYVDPARLLELDLSADADDAGAGAPQKLKEPRAPTPEVEAIDEDE